MTVGELRKVLEDIDSEAKVFVNSVDTFTIHWTKQLYENYPKGTMFALPEPPPNRLDICKVSVC